MILLFLLGLELWEEGFLSFPPSLLVVNHVGQYFCPLSVPRIDRYWPEESSHHSSLFLLPIAAVTCIFSAWRWLSQGSAFRPIFFFALLSLTAERSSHFPPLFLILILMISIVLTFIFMEKLKIYILWHDDSLGATSCISWVPKNSELLGRESLYTAQNRKAISIYVFFISLVPLISHSFAQGWRQSKQHATFLLLAWALTTQETPSLVLSEKTMPIGLVTQMSLAKQIKLPQ